MKRLSSAFGQATIQSGNPIPGEISNRLGWLTIAEEMLGNVDRLDRFVEQVRRRWLYRCRAAGHGRLEPGARGFQQSLRHGRWLPES